MSDRNPEAVQFLKSLNIKTTALGGFSKGATFATLEQLSDIYEAALEAQRAESREKEAALKAQLVEYRGKEAALQEQQKNFTSQVGESLLQREQERRTILAQAKAEAARIVASAKDTALRQAAQATGSLEHAQKEKTVVISELKLIREQINDLLASQPCQPAALPTQPVSAMKSKS